MLQQALPKLDTGCYLVLLIPDHVVGAVYGTSQNWGTSGYAIFRELYLKNQTRWEAELLGHENIY